MKRVVLYTLRSCPFCVRAKALLDSKGADYDEVDVTADWDERSRISRESGHRTFPQVFIDSAFVGGSDELCALDRAGKLDPMLE